MTSKVTVFALVNHRKTDEALERGEDDIPHKSIITSKGWEMLVRWEGGTTSWVPLKDIKMADPLMTAEYAVTSNLQEELAFSLWVSHTLQTRKRAISRLKASKVSMGNIKFEIKIPTTEETKELDRVNGNDYRKKAEKELIKV